MKKIIMLWMVVVIVIGMCSCGKHEAEENTSEKKDVWAVSSYEELDDIEYVKELDVFPSYISKVQVKLYEIKYKSDDCNVISYISIPEECLKQKKAYPVIIYNRGGNKDFGINEPDFIANLASGFDKIVVASNYRGSSRSDGKDEFGGADVNDVIKLIDLCEKFEFADKDKIYMLGISRGGMMSYMAARRDNRIKKIAVGGGLADAFMGYNDRDDMKPIMEELIGGSPTDIPEEYEKRSATYWADEIKCPVLIIHSKLDPRVSFSQAQKLVSELKKANKEYEFVEYEDDVHGIHKEDYSKIEEWFNN